MNGFYPIILVGNLVLLFIIMKKLSSRLVTTNKTIWGSPSLVTSRTLFTPELSSILIRQLVFFVLTYLTLKLLQDTFAPLTLWYERLLAFPLVWFATEWLGATLMLLFMLPKHTPFIHNQPLNSKSISDFWGNRWNRWVSPWLSLAGRKFSSSPSIQMMMAFLLSGIFHELMFNLPFQIATGEVVYGNMLMFFIFQAIAVYIDRRYLKGFPTALRRCWLWVTLIFSSPLFLERPLLYFFGLSS